MTERREQLSEFQAMLNSRCREGDIGARPVVLAQISDVALDQFHLTPVRAQALGRARESVRGPPRAHARNRCTTAIARSNRLYPEYSFRMRAR